MNQIDPIILGDNQFFGVNHFSPEKGRNGEERFRDLNEIKKVIYWAVDNGVEAILFSTHPAVGQITKMLRADQKLKNLSIYVNVPYIAKYVRMFSEKGMLGTAVKILTTQSGIDGITLPIKSVFSSLKALLTNDYFPLLNRLVDAELSPFKGLNIKVIFLHDALTGLAIGYEMKEVIRNFYNHIKDKYGAIPGFDTLNYVKTCELLKELEIKDTLIMAAFNKKGYFMNPSKNECENALLSYGLPTLAMSTLAAGSLVPEEAYKYISTIGIKNVVVGLSTKQHADHTFRLLNNILRKN